MKNKFESTMRVIKYIYDNAKIKIHRSGTDFLADRIVQSGTEETLLSFMERLSKLMDADIGSLWESQGVEFINVTGSIEAPMILQWLRSYPRIAAMIAGLPKMDQFREACESIVVEDVKAKEGRALTQGEFEIKIKLTTLSPLSHGADTKAGNATLFRRMNVLSDKGSTLNLPFYSGNAIRGEIRDLLADYFLTSIGIIPSRNKMNIALWFFHALYAGGALEEDSKAAKALGTALGANGAIKAEGIYTFRDTLPALSVLGCALGNRILSGRVQVSDFRPECFEWNNGEIPAAQLFEWSFLTRREDNEGHEDGENKSMIANAECLKAGVVLRGGVDLSTHISDLEKSAFAKGLELLKDKGHIGAESRRGFGKILVDIENLPNSTLYDDYLAENKDKILAYLESLGALCTQ
jgi:hypothetical protein